MTMSEPTSIKDCILSDDPLSNDIINYLLNYREETELLDFKITLENVDKEWLEITKDILAFTNTHGGYLVFGVQNATFDFVGLSPESLALISDSNKFMQKINKYVEPPINLIRCKRYKHSDKDLVAIYIPPSRDKTHMVSQDGSFKYDSDKEKIVLRKNTSYVRVSAGNHLMDSRDIDEIVIRRMEHFKRTLLEGITKVVEAPVDTKVFLMTEDETNPKETRYIVKHAPDSTNMVGRSFTVSPNTNEEEVDNWVSINIRQPEAIPPQVTTWRWYKERDSINLSPEQRIWVAKFSLLTSAPAFYWLRGCDAIKINEMLKDALEYETTIDNISNIIYTAAFIGKKYYYQLIASIGKKSSQIFQKSKDIPHDDPKNFFRTNRITTNFNDSEAELNLFLEKIEVPIRLGKLKAQSYDCFLYAQDDKYKNT